MKIIADANHFFHKCAKLLNFYLNYLTSTYTIACSVKQAHVLLNRQAHSLNANLLMVTVDVFGCILKFEWIKYIFPFLSLVFESGQYSYENLKEKQLGTNFGLSYHNMSSNWALLVSSPFFRNCNT